MSVNRVRAIFIELVANVPPAQWEVRLADLAGDDRELHGKVAGLLAAHRREDSFLEQPAGPLWATEEEAPAATSTDEPRTGPSGTEQPGVVLADRYKLLQPIGEGGMGSVWMAEQTEPVRRQVAVKLIKAGMGSKQILARFEAERQALAIMDHPNIAKVHDAGTTPDGRPFFVMELVQGVSITRYCDEHRLTPQQRLELFVPVCRAIQHAHQKGIIHRDVKPSNVLVTLYDDKPAPKVIDFGIAKATSPQPGEPPLHTGFGGLVGTAEYMSPEQAGFNRLDVDTRSDVYALGVLLYELLTGTTPFTGERLGAAGYDEMRRIIREEEPARPSVRISTLGEALTAVSAQRQTDPRRLSQVFRGEVDWIVMKALEKDRGRRYESANDFAADVQRYLADEPVEACPPSASYRLRKYARKYRTVLATVGVFAALLVAATVTSIGLASWALQERNHAEEQKRAAERSFTRALDAVDKMLTRVGEVQLSHIPQMELVRRDLLQDALRFYQEFLRERGDSLAVRSEAASAYRRVGQIQVLLGQRAEGEEAYGQAVALLEKLLDESPGDPTLLNKLAEVHNFLGLLYYATQRWPQAEAALERGVALLEQPGPPGPMPLMHRRTLAGIHANLVLLYRQTGELDKAESAFLKGRTLLENLLAVDPKDVKSLTLLANCHGNVGLVYAARGSNREAEAAYQKDLDLVQQLIRDDPENVSHQKRLAQAHNNRGLLYTRTRQHDKAEAAYKQSLALNEAILRDHPKVITFIVEVGGSYSNMATHVRRNRSPEESLEWSAKAIGTLEPVLEKDARDVYARVTLFDAFVGRGHALLQLNRREEAVKDWRRLIEISAGQAHINMRLYRLPALARLGEHVQAAAEVETLVAEGHVQGLNLSLFANVHSLCSAAAVNDARLPPAEREKLADQYAGRAVELLRRAQAAGYFRDPDRLARMKENKDLDAIRSRPDFQGLLVELEKKVKHEP